MTKRRLFWLAYAACVLLAVFWGARLLTPRHRINRESLEKIQVGMTLEEVEAILGVPPGDYATKEIGIAWVGEEGAIHVMLNPEGRVSYLAWLEPWRELIGEVTFLDKLRGWFGLRQMYPVSSYPLPPDW
ncbi:MAG TPA: hypothetical protein VKE98_02090 [Gemmataceae bacterium]|nr:hypothetical protein [Gemmataceae bacterium]